MRLQPRSLCIHSKHLVRVQGACVCCALLASPAFQRTTSKGLRSTCKMFLVHMRGGAGRYGLAGRDGVDAAAGTYSRSRLVKSPIPRTLSHATASTAPAFLSMSIPPSLLSLNGNSEVVRDHEMRRAMKANVVDKMAVTPRLDLWGPLEHYPNAP